MTIVVMTTVTFKACKSSSSMQVSKTIMNTGGAQVTLYRKYILSLQTYN